MSTFFTIVCQCHLLCICFKVSDLFSLFVYAFLSLKPNGTYNDWKEKLWIDKNIHLHV